MVCFKGILMNMIKKILGLMLITSSITVFGMDQAPTATSTTPAQSAPTKWDILLRNAAESGNIALAKAALKHGADPKRIWYMKFTPSGSTYNHLPTNDEYESNETALDLALDDQNTAVAKLLINIVNPSPNKKLIMGAILGDLKIIKSALNNDADINNTEYDDSTPLEEAIFYSDANIVQFLLAQPKIDINKNNPLIVAARMATELKDFEIFRVFEPKATPENPEIIKLLLKNPKINVNAKDSMGSTAFIVAVENENHLSALAIINNSRWKPSSDDNPLLESLFYLQPHIGARSLIQALIKRETSQKVLNEALGDATKTMIEFANQDPSDHWNQEISDLFKDIFTYLIQKGAQPGTKTIQLENEGLISPLNYLMRHKKLGLIKTILP